MTRGGAGSIKSSDGLKEHVKGFNREDFGVLREHLQRKRPPQ